MKKLIIALSVVFFGVISVPVLAVTACTSQATENSHFLMKNNGTVIHLPTGLMWSRCVFGQDWDAGSTSCTGAAIQPSLWGMTDLLVNPLTDQVPQAALFRTGGHTDWRIPNVKELLSILDTCKASGERINTLAFLSQTTSYNYWTSTSVTLGDGSTGNGGGLEETKGRAYVVNFDADTNSVIARDQNKMNGSAFVRLVRNATAADYVAD